MPCLKVRFNYAFNIYDDSTKGSIAVYKRDGGTQSVRWLGFIGLEKAKRIKGAVPVKIKAEQFSDEAVPMNFQNVPAGQYVQGCLVNNGVYAILESRVRVVSDRK